MPGGLNQKSALALDMSNKSYEDNFFQCIHELNGFSDVLAWGGTSDSYYSLVYSS